MKKRSFIYIILAGILWGTSGIFFNLLKPFGFNPIQMTAMRGGVAAISFLIYTFIHNKNLFKISKKEFIIFALSGVAMYATGALYYGAIQASSVSTAVILMYTAPVFVMAFSVMYLGEKLTKLKFVSVIFMIIGCALVSGVVGGMKFSALGIAMGLGSGIAYSLYNIFTKIEMMHKSNSISATLYCFIIMGTISVLFANPPQIVSFTMQNPYVIVPLMIGIGICTSVLPYFLYTDALKYIPVGTAAALGIVEPMAATIFSVVIFNEKLTVFSVCGIVLILISVFLLSRSDA